MQIIVMIIIALTCVATILLSSLAKGLEQDPNVRDDLAPSTPGHKRVSLNNADGTFLDEMIIILAQHSVVTLNEQSSSKLLRLLLNVRHQPKSEPFHDAIAAPPVPFTAQPTMQITNPFTVTTAPPPPTIGVKPHAIITVADSDKDGRPHLFMALVNHSGIVESTKTAPVASPVPHLLIGDVNPDITAPHLLMNVTMPSTTSASSQMPPTYSVINATSSFLTKNSSHHHQEKAGKRLVEKSDALPSTTSSPKPALEAKLSKRSYSGSKNGLAKDKPATSMTKSSVDEQNDDDGENEKTENEPTTEPIIPN